MHRDEYIARRLTAHKMGLVDDPDGERLPDDLWKQCLRDVELVFEIWTEWRMGRLSRSIARIVNGK
jgi:hypothetical protein